MKKSSLILIFGLILTTVLWGQNVTRILTNVEPPTNYYVNGRLTGTTVEIVEELKKKVGSSVSIDELPWARAYGIAKSTPGVAIFTAGRSQERIDLGFNFLGPVFTRTQTLYAKKGSTIKISSYNDIVKQGLKVAAQRDDWRAKLLRDKGVTVVEATSHKQNILKLVNGRIDLWISNDVEAPSVLKEDGFSMNDIEPLFEVMVSSSYIMLSKGTSAAEVKRWEKAFNELAAAGVLDKLAAKWSSTLGLSLKYSREKGFYPE